MHCIVSATVNCVQILKHKNPNEVDKIHLSKNRTILITEKPDVLIQLLGG